MKNLFLIIVPFLLNANHGAAQTVPHCGSDEATNYFIKNLPGYKQQVEKANQKNAQEFQAYKIRLESQNAANRSAGIPATYNFTVPVVFHVLHTNGSENVSDAACIAALVAVNKDYAKQGSDTTTIDPLYAPLYVNSHMRFQLAKKDPKGNCTTGIVHHYDENTQWKQSDLYNYKYSTVGTNNWSPSRYLNIYVVANIIGDIQAGLSIGGYTYKPGTSPNVGSDAIVLSLGLLLDPTSRGLSHEIGHWFGLSHTFDGNGGFTLATGVGVRCGNDDIYDTPATPGFVSICPNYLTISDSCDIGRRPNMHNIMDYASCPKMFTQGQTDKVRFSAQSSTANRDYLVDTANLVFTGILSRTMTVVTNTATNQTDTLKIYAVAPTTVCAPIADFYATKAKSCQGQTVVYNSTSYNGTAGLTYNWTFDGGAPSTSTLSVPSVTYNTPGTFSTTLVVTNTVGTSSKTVPSFMSVSWHSDPISYPAMQNFEGGSLPTNWNIINKDFSTLTWQISPYGSQGSGHSMVLPNQNGGNTFTGGNIDILETSQYNFNNTSSITVTFDYSYATTTNSATVGTFKFEYSDDCGGIWKPMPSSPTALSMAASGGTVTAPYIPFTQAKWITKTFNPLSLGALNGKGDVKFRFWFENGSTSMAQNLYIDNFNISGTVGLEEMANTIGLIIYPNPTTASAIVEFTSPVNSKVNVSVFDVMGRMVEEIAFDSIAGIATKYSVNKNGNLKGGIYFISLSLNGQKITKKLIIE